MQTPDRQPPLPLLNSWASGTRLARFMSELGISRAGFNLGTDATAAVLRHVRAATEAEFAASGVEHSRVDVFRASNEVGGAVLTDLRSQAPSERDLERFSAAVH